MSKAHQATGTKHRHKEAILLLAVCLASGASVWLGAMRGQGWEAGCLAAVCAALGGIGARLRPTHWTRAMQLLGATLSACGVVYFSGGRPEACFSFFVLGALLPCHRSWRGVVIIGAALAGFVLWGAPAALASAMHVPVLLAMLGLQYAYAAYVAAREERAESERFELDFLIRAMGFDGPIRLNLEVLRADSAVGQRLKHVQQRMAAAIREVNHAISGVQAASEVLRQGSEELTQRTNSTAMGLRDAAMSLEQINLIVQTSAEASVEARAMAARATELANNGGELVRQVVTTMRDISQSSGKITDIISVIDGIAFQTNILALNAAVEAARAGEQGKGFAVVAAEVRSLALRSSEAAREIKSLISASMQTIEAGVEQVNLTGGTMEHIVDAVRRVGEVFDQLSADSHEHAGGIGVVTQSVQELDTVTQQNIAVAERSSNIAAGLMEHAERMSEVLSAFKLGEAASAMPNRVVGAEAGGGSVQAKAPLPMETAPPVASRAAGAVAAASKPGHRPAVKQEATAVEFF